MPTVSSLCACKLYACRIVYTWLSQKWACSMFDVEMWQVQNNRLYLRYGSNFVITTAKWDKTLTDKKPSLFYCEKCSKSSARPYKSWEKQTWKFQFCSCSFFFLFLTHNSVQSNLDYPNSLGPCKNVGIIEGSDNRGYINIQFLWRDRAEAFG